MISWATADPAVSARFSPRWSNWSRPRIALATAPWRPRCLRFGAGDQVRRRGYIVLVWRLPDRGGLGIAWPGSDLAIVAIALIFLTIGVTAAIISRQALIEVARWVFVPAPE